MKRSFILAALFGLLSLTAFCQIPNHGGEWTLDVSKSKLPRQMNNVESITLTITQSASELKVITASMRSTAANVSEENVTYNLAGSEIKADLNLGGMTGTVRSRAKTVGGVLSLKTERNIKTQSGDVSAVTRETWELSPDGRTLTIRRETQTPQEKMTAHLIFTKR